MKKYGKYSKKPAAKSLLLQTYFTSLLSLMLCVAMFLGTSYAWFVSEVNNTGNEIYIGTLDATLEKQTKDGNWISLADPAQPQDGQEKVTLFDKGIRWEPGVTTMETVKITNKGDLAFKYVLSFTDGTLEKGGAKVETEGTLAAVAKNFDVWFHERAEENEKLPTAYKDITAADSGWTKAGTLDQMLAGTPVFTGTMDQVRKTGLDPKDANANTTDGVKTEKVYDIALHMNEDATAVAMSHKISLNVKMVAYQMVSESDSFDNSYDELGYVSTVDELVKAVAEAKDGDVIAVAGGTYDLTKNPLKIEKSIALQALNPEDKPVLQFVMATGSRAIEICADNVKVKDLILSVDPTKDSSGAMIEIAKKDDGKFYSDIVIDGCSFTGAENCVAMYGNNVTVRNCVMDASTADNAGKLLQVWGTSGVLTVENNRFLGKENSVNCNTIAFVNKNSTGSVTGQIRILDNTFTNVFRAVSHTEEMKYEKVSVEMLNNHIVGCVDAPVVVAKGGYESYKINGNLFVSVAVAKNWIVNSTEVNIDASGNFWNAKDPVADELVTEKVTVNDYYVDIEKANLKTK